MAITKQNLVSAAQIAKAADAAAAFLQLARLSDPQAISDALWEGSPLSIPHGGTGADTLTDGAILLGNGTGALQSLALTTAGAIVIGDGTTDPTTLSAFTSATGTLKHEYGGLEADVSAYAGLVKITGGATSAVPVTTFAESILDDADEATFKATVNLEAGTDFNAYDAGVASIAGLTTGVDKFIYTTAADTYAVGDAPAYGRSIIATASEAAFKL